MNALSKILALTLAVLFTVGVLASCGKTETGSGDKDVEAAKQIRYLNFKPEVADLYKEIAEKYEAETGVKVIVETAANNTYEQTLMSKMATDEAPTIFQINGPRGYANWKDYCADLTDSDIYNHLSDKT